MTDKMSGLAIVGPGVGLFHKLLYVVFAEQVNGQISAVPHFFHRAGFAGGAKAHVGRVAACGPGGGVSVDGHILGILTGAEFVHYAQRG